MDTNRLIKGSVTKFVKNFLAGSTNGIRGAFEAYVKAVKNGSFPGT
jgi:ketopantoate hydroxymethyltransferase